MKERLWVLKFDDCECWISTFTGDPGRTLVKGNAKTFKTKDSAQKHSKMLIKKNGHRRFRLIADILE